MRPSKTRSRGSKNRNIRPTGGNIINRVFDSSGPEGKVRGTPAQIIEKYLQHHRDAQLSGDRVNAENFSQHAEHYTRMLAEATREAERAREEQEEANRQRQADRDRQRQQREEQDGGRADDDQRTRAVQDEGESTLVDLPEGKPAFLDARPRQDRRSRSQKPEQDDAAADAAPQAEAKPARAPRAPRTRKPRNPSGDGESAGGEGSTPATVSDDVAS